MDVARYIVESASDYAIIFCDPAGTIQFWNPGAIRAFGYIPEEAVGKHFSLLFRDEDRQSGIPDNELRKAESEHRVNDSRWMVRRDGESFWAEGATYAIHENGSLAGYSTIVRDASERLRLEQLLERTNEEKEKFAYTISHDLKEPLRTIRSYTELLQRRYKGRLDGDADEFMEFILEGVVRMDRLLADILSYSQAGRHDKTRPEPTQAANVLQWALMNIDGMAKQNSATITWDPLPVILADQNQLMTLFQHLLTNAIKFRSAAPPQIHVSAERQNASRWLFRIKDNGVGMEQDQTERMFGIFKRLVGREVPGTGVGLAICRKIVEAHGGRIWIDSTPGNGSTVNLTLPAYED